jgi:membrane protein DedA with SNARE-associated domain
VTPFVLAAIFSVSSGLGYLLPAVIGLESMGVPSPGETALILAAVLASQGKLNIVLVLVIGIASAIIGDNLGYLLGRKIGREVLEAKGPFLKRRKMLIAAGDRFFDKHGGKAVFLARWVALVRVAAAWLAGINEMKFIHFFAWNALGAITWGTTFGLVGYYGGKSAANAITHYGVIAAIVLGVLIVLGLVVWQIRERRAHHAAEAAVEADPADPPEPAAAEPAAAQPSEPDLADPPEPAAADPAAAQPSERGEP